MGTKQADITQMNLEENVTQHNRRPSIIREEIVMVLNELKCNKAHGVNNLCEKMLIAMLYKEKMIDLVY